MAAYEKELVPVFIPSLGLLLVRAEDRKGEPLSYNEVIRIRDNAACMMMTLEDARKLSDSRDHHIDPENCWFEWQHLRRKLGRKPDLDPGPRLYLIRSADPEYQLTIRDAHATLDQFRSMLPADSGRRQDAMVKTEIKQGDNQAFMWLSNTRMSGNDFVAKFFEISERFSNYHVGDELEIPEEAVLDWMVNDNGVLHGGFSIRYYRSTLPENEREQYDRYIGAVVYA
ncbi:MAG: DUF2314 domain-containing protein [Gemmataceae bacterium]